MEPLLRTFVEQHPEDAARVLETLDFADAVEFLGQMPPASIVPLVERLAPQIGAPIVQALELEQRRTIFDRLAPRVGSTLLQHFDEQPREETLDALAARRATELRNLLKYPADTAGGLMAPRVASIPLDLTVQQTIDRIRRTPRTALYYLYVTARNGELVGVLNMRDLLLASPTERIERMVHRPAISVPATADREELVDLMRSKRFLALPVVDEAGKLVGVVEHEEVLEAGQEEAFEDMQVMVGAGSDERALSPVFTVVKRRLPWLYVNLATAFFAAAVVRLFSGVIEQVTALAVLLPVVAGQGGNSGSQSMAVVMRGLAMREIVPGAAWRILVKEVLAGLLNGLAVALVTAVIVFAWWQSTAGPAQSLSLALVIGVAMVANVLVAVAAGALIPLGLKALNRDPAQSATIFLTTVTDVIGFGAFLGLALLALEFLR